ncbi:PAS domain S-box protein [Pedobacter glucosidilyticus]|uniref:PAS domain S-box protein n=1 Tax=Pedobacter glucosidilyticus TaxID=1122941 RepID=UPI0026EE5A45|nr:PAS domain S-box protein [Pedobacter glucosidilyticus]
MNEKKVYQTLEIASVALLFIISITVILFFIDSLDLIIFKIIIAILMVAAISFFLLLRRTISVTIQNAKYKFKSAEHKFGRIYDANVLGILISDFNGLILDANDAFLDIIGYTREELENGFIRWDQLTPPEFKQESLQALQQLKEQGECLPFEKQYYHKNGSKVWVLVGAARLLNDKRGDAITYVIDISAKKEVDIKTKQFNNIIKRQQEEFKSVFMNAPAYILIRRGPELRYTFVNKAITDFTQREDYLGKTPEELFPDLVSDEDKKISEQVYKTGIAAKGKRHKARYKNEHGEMQNIYLDYLITPVYDYEGRVDGIATFGFDVTDLVLANQEMEISKDRFASMADTMPEKVWMTSASGKELIYVNKLWLDYVGQPSSNGWSWYDTVHPEDKAIVQILWSQAMKYDQNFTIEARLQNTKGEFRWHLIKGVPLKNKENEVLVWVGSNSDIHDQKQQLKQLKDSEEYFKTLADETPFMVWKSDAEGHFVYVNKQWTAFTGLSVTESLGEGFRKAIPSVDDEERKLGWANAIATKQSYQDKFQLKRADGALRWVYAQANPYDIDGEFAGFIGSIIDITEQELVQQAEKELSAKKDEFLSIASHELKTPLTSVKAFIQLIEKSLNKHDKAYPFVLKASKNLKRLEILIADLLDVSKINAGKLTYHIKSFDFHQMLEESIASIQNISPTHQINLVESAKVNLCGDKFRIEQVIYNFLSNAIKYSPNAKEVSVTSKVHDKHLVVAVQDYGIGISDHHIAHISDRYFRVDKTAMQFQGLGLGLFISKEIIHRHDGNFWIESELGKGSTFYFSLPLEAQHPKINSSIT